MDLLSVHLSIVQRTTRDLAAAHAVKRAIPTRIRIRSLRMEEAPARTYPDEGFEGVYEWGDNNHTPLL